MESFSIPGTSDIFGGIRVDKPCAVLFDKKENGFVVTVSDPFHSLDEINMEINGNYNGDSMTSIGDKTLVKVDLPKGDQRGSTVAYVLEN